MRIGEALKKARESKGLTQAQLAERLFVDTSLICRWEKGQRNVTLCQLEVILGALDMTFAELKRLENVDE